MPSRLALCLAVAVAAIAVIVSVGTLVGQETLNPNADALARFSYRGGRISQTSTNFCFAVAPSGNYWIHRWRATEESPTLAGKLSRQQVRQLDDLLSDPGFRAPRAPDSGFVTRGSETFIAQLSGEPPAKSNDNRYMVWANRDGRTPFPAAVTRVIRWISQLGIKDVKPVPGTGICPGRAMPLQPSVEPVR